MTWCLTKDGGKIKFLPPIDSRKSLKSQLKSCTVARITESDRFDLFLLPLTRRYVQSSLLTDIVLIFNPSPKVWLRPDSFRKQFGPNRQTDMIQWPTRLRSRTHSRILPSRASSLHALPMQRWLHSVHIALATFHHSRAVPHIRPNTYDVLRYSYSCSM